MKNIDLNKIKELGVQYKHSGYNCCQAVLMACKDYLDIDEEKIKNIASGFGVGMGSMKATCGALCGVIICSGLIKKNENNIFISKDILETFEKKSKATICGDLKGIKTGKVLCSCDDCVRNALESLFEVLNK